MTYFTFLRNNLKEFLTFIFLSNVGNVTEIAEEIIRISDIVIMQENKFQSTGNGATSKTASKQPSSSEVNNCGPHALYLGQNQCLCGDGFDNEKNGTCIEIKDIDTKQSSYLNCHRGLC